MTKIGTLLFTAFICVEILAVYASANQNVFATRDDDTVSTGYGDSQTQYASPSSNDFNIKIDKRMGRARGGDRLVDVGSTSAMSFFPRDLALSEELVKEMNENLPTCVLEAARAAGMRGNLTSINVAHMGGYVNRRVNNGSRRRSRAWSLHSTGRALDIGRIDVTVGGKTLRVPMTIKSHRGQLGREEAAFYKKFGTCWKEKVTSSCGKKTMLDCTYNRLHHDHVHISLPLCGARSAGIAST